MVQQKSDLIKAAEERDEFVKEMELKNKERFLKAQKERQKKDEERHEEFLYDELGKGLLDALPKYRSWRFNARDDFELPIEGRVTMADLPLHRVTYYLLPIFDFDFVHRHPAPDLYDPTHLGSLLVHVEKYLSEVDDDEGIEGALAWLYEDPNTLRLIAELLVLNKIYPNRTAVAFLDKKTEVVRRGSLVEDSILGKENAANLKTALDMFLEVVEMDLMTKPSLEQPHPSQAYTDLIFALVDDDEDDIFSQTESKEFCRMILSRPILGQLLTTAAMILSTEGRASGDLSKRRATYITVVPTVVLNYVQQEGIDWIATSFWQKLDLDGDGSVTGEEFREDFVHCVWESIVLPLAGLLVEAGELAWQKGLNPQAKKTTSEGIFHVGFGRDEKLKGIAPEERSKSQRNCMGAELDIFASCMPVEPSQRVNKDVPNEFGNGEIRDSKKEDDYTAYEESCNSGPDACKVQDPVAAVKERRQLELRGKPPDPIIDAEVESNRKATCEGKCIVM